jgi:4-hydroxybenzoate polyprenyltransferase
MWILATSAIVDTDGSVEVTSHQNQFTGASRLKLFWALSRTPHGLLDMATPAFGALLWLGAFPPLPVILLGLLTTFAGYTSVYALNDVVDHRMDREKLKHCEAGDSCNYLDAVLIRHPIAQGVLRLRDGFLWALAWGLVALLGAYALNPVCALIFLIGCALETAYCFMLKVSHLRVLVSGVVKTSGAIAAVFAVDPNPSFYYLTFLFLCLYFWEIGGQNVPADWTDVEEDRELHAKTIPVRFGPDGSTTIILGSLIIALVMNLVLFRFSGIGFDFPCVLASLLLGIYLLLIPAIRLYGSKDRLDATALFNKASYYPVVLLLVVVVRLVI